MIASADLLFPGLQNPVHDSQTIFRDLLLAMSEPGVVCNIKNNLKHPKSLHPASYGLALSIMDQDTRLKLSRGVDKPELRQVLRFHNSVPIIDDTKQADFFICNEDDAPDLRELNPGTETYPDQSCTLIIQCHSFSNGCRFTASGPGIRSTRTICCSGIDKDLVLQRERLSNAFPLGIDLILTSGRQFFCIPRTTHLEVENALCT